MRLLPPVLAIALSAGCAGAPGLGVTPAVAGSASARQATADLTGKVKAPASLISDRGAGLVSNNGSGVISNNGGTWRLLAATPWQAAGGVSVTLLSANGTPFGEPVKTSQDGAFRFKGVPKGAAWIAQASLAEGRVMATLARAGEEAVTVSPASTVALAVARTRAVDVETVAPTAFGALASEIEAHLVRTDARIDLANPLAVFRAIADESPAAAAAADAIGAVGQGTAGAEAPRAWTTFVSLPEAPVALAAHGPHVLALLPRARKVWTDQDESLVKTEALAFSPSTLAVSGDSAYVYDQAKGRFVRFTIDAATLALTEAGERPLRITPAPQITRAAVSSDGVILANAPQFPLPSLGGEAYLRLAEGGVHALLNLPHQIRGVATSAADTFWIGTDATAGNLVILEKGTSVGTAITIPHPITDVARAPDGTVYVATSDPGHGLYAVKDGVATDQGVTMALDHVIVPASGVVHVASGARLYRR